MNLQRAFKYSKLTENGDIAFSSTGNKYIDILFFAEYYTLHPEEADIDDSEKSKLFAMMMRDPRCGLGYRNLGRHLMAKAGVSAEDTVLAGRFDDLLFPEVRGLDYIKAQIDNGNELAKKWMPRFGSTKKALASKIAKAFGLNKQQYGKYVKVQTTESLLTEGRTEEIKFETVPSKAMLRYWKRFNNGSDTQKRFNEYLEAVENGDAKLNVATTTVYDIFKNRASINPDLCFDKIEKISVNCVPIVDTSGSMWDENDSIGKAIAIGHYLAKCSTFAPNNAIAFSSQPIWLDLNATSMRNKFGDSRSRYMKEVNNLYTGDCSNTNFGAVLDLIRKCDTTQFPDYFVVLSDMEFDQGSSMSLEMTMELFRNSNCGSKIVWWNLNSRQKTAPEMDQYGNIFFSGYTPMLLSYLKAGFNANQFLDFLLEEYGRKVFATNDSK